MVCITHGFAPSNDSTKEVKVTRTVLLCALFASSIFATGCTAEVGVEAESPPAAPVAEVEVQTASPGAEYVWVAGYHRWYGGRYVWARGHWDRRPHANAMWRTGRWERRGRRQVWIEGRWE